MFTDISASEVALRMTCCTYRVKFVSKKRTFNEKPLLSFVLSLYVWPCLLVSAYGSSILR